MAADYTELLMKRLDEARPDRYIAKDWIDRVADSIPVDVAQVEDLARELLRSKARSIEENRTSSGNAMAREYHTTGQQPLDWQLAGESPISFWNTILVDGKPKKVRERVKLSCASVADLQLWADTERNAANADHAARMKTVAGIERWESEMTRLGALSWGAYQRAVQAGEASA